MTRRWSALRLLLPLLAVLLLLSPRLQAHEMGTSALTLKEFSPGEGKLVFKRSRAADGNMAPIEFQFQPACDTRQSHIEWESDNEVYQFADFKCSAPLTGHTLTVGGFMRLSPDLILQVDLLNAPPLRAVLNPQQPSLLLQASPSNTGTDNIHREYLGIGVEHILFGMDHVLFVAGLLLLWQKRQQKLGSLLLLFTLFTVGHSLTLALQVLGWIAVPTRLIEAWIALSVLWLAITWVYEPQASAHTGSKPPLKDQALILAFGLLHGSGFALSMANRGFPEESLLSTLFLFNVGIELGQLLIVFLLLLMFALLKKMPSPRLFDHAQSLCVVTMGGASLFWTIQRVSAYV